MSLMKSIISMLFDMHFRRDWILDSLPIYSQVRSEMQKQTKGRAMAQNFSVPQRTLFSLLCSLGTTLVQSPAGPVSDVV